LSAFFKYVVATCFSKIKTNSISCHAWLNQAKTPHTNLRLPNAWALGSRFEISVLN